MARNRKRKGTDVNEHKSLLRALYALDKPASDLEEAMFRRGGPQSTRIFYGPEEHEALRRVAAYEEPWSTHCLPGAEGKSCARPAAERTI